MKNKILPLLTAVLTLTVLSGCAGEERPGERTENETERDTVKEETVLPPESAEETEPDVTAAEETDIPSGAWRSITQEEAKRIMDEGGDFVILDVREQDEYDEGHIPGAVLMPYTRTEELAPLLVPEKNRKILVYCRSGRRSKIAAQSLTDLGYTDVLEFGGIIDWSYGTER